jgi:archaellum component FlaC
MNLDATHAMIETIALIVSFAGFIVVLMIKAAQNETKSELKEQLHRTSEDIKVHTARDEEKFDSIDSSLIRLDNNGGRMEGKIDRLVEDASRRGRS